MIGSGGPEVSGGRRSIGDCTAAIDTATTWAKAETAVAMSVRRRLAACIRSGSLACRAQGRGLAAISWPYRGSGRRDVGLDAERTLRRGDEAGAKCQPVRRQRLLLSGSEGDVATDAGCAPGLAAWIRVE